jgi:phosphatidylethanolamine/phosphatidyl-N-methylethanolamine N-methyltransferase
MPSFRDLWLRASYTLGSPIYDLLAGGLRRYRKRAFEIFSLTPGSRVLLLGAGTGLDLEFLPRDSKVLAVDLTPAMLARLRRRAARLGIDVETRVGDAQALEVPDGSCDAAVLSFLLAVIPDPIRCLGEAERALRAGGRVLILDKFVLDQGRPPLALRILHPLARLLGTGLTVRLGPILASSRLRKTRDEAAGLRGYLRIVVLEKDA